MNYRIKEFFNQKKIKNKYPEIIAVSKTFSMDKIMPLVEYGHIHFGENKIQEAEEKWSSFNKNNNNVMLHMIGKLQTNKAKKAVKLFDYIHSLDSHKLAEKISKYENELNRKMKIFIQVNLTRESNKSGINKKDLKKFYLFCTKKLSLNIIGLMCLPPLNKNSSDYFLSLKNLSTELNLKELSMGMTHDYIDAINYGSTFLRIGTLIFGKRKANQL